MPALRPILSRAAVCGVLPAFLSVFMIGALAPPAAAQQPSEDEAGEARLDAVEARYRSLDGLEAEFRQVARPPEGGATRIQGRLLLRNNKYRIETPEQTLVTDGRTTWVYTPADSQVIVNDASDDPSTLSPQTFFTDYGERYRVERVESAASNRKATTVLRLTPRSPASGYERVSLWVRDDDIVTRLRATDAAGTTYTITLDRIQIDPPLEASDFTFSAPDGVEVVDLRAS